MKISVVIINKNDRKVEDTLAAVSKLKTPYMIEIIVVDSSNDQLDDIYDKYSSIKKVPYKSPAHKPITIPEQRNLGVQVSRGEVIVFIDASCVPENDWLGHLTRRIISKKEVIVVGPALSRGKSTQHDQAHEDNKAKKHLEECGTGNLAFTRQLYEEIGGFDERFEYGSDVDFSWRIVNAGYKIYYEPKAVIRHDWGDNKQELKRSYRYGKARARLHLKHKNRRSYLLKHDPVALVYPIFIIGLPITFWLPWYPGLIIIPVLKNISKNPIYTVLDHLIYGIGVLREAIPYAVKKPFGAWA